MLKQIETTASRLADAHQAAEAAAIHASEIVIVHNADGSTTATHPRAQRIQWR